MRVSLIDAGAGLVVADRRVDDLADEQRVGAEVERVAHRAVEPRDGLVEHRRAGGGRVHRPAVERAPSSTAGLENFTNTLVSSASHRFTVNDPPSVIRRWVTALLSTPTPISTGSIDSCVIQLVVIALRSSPDRDPTSASGVGDLPRDLVEQLVVEGHAAERTAGVL